MDEDEFDEEREDIIRAKWLMDGASTLSEAASQLRKAADDLEDLERQGWQLTQPVEDDYGFIRQEEPVLTPEQAAEVIAFAEATGGTAWVDEQGRRLR